DVGQRPQSRYRPLSLPSFHSSPPVPLVSVARLHGSRPSTSRVSTKSLCSDTTPSTRKSGPAGGREDPGGVGLELRRPGHRPEAPDVLSSPEAPLMPLSRGLGRPVSTLTIGWFLWQPTALGSSLLSTVGTTQAGWDQGEHCPLRGPGSSPHTPRHPAGTGVSTCLRNTERGDPGGDPLELRGARHCGLEFLPWLLISSLNRGTLNSPPALGRRASRHAPCLVRYAPRPPQRPPLSAAVSTRPSAPAAFGAAGSGWRQPPLQWLEEQNLLLKKLPSRPRVDAPSQCQPRSPERGFLCWCREWVGRGRPPWRWPLRSDCGRARLSRRTAGGARGQGPAAATEVSCFGIRLSAAAALTGAPASESLVLRFMVIFFPSTEIEKFQKGEGKDEEKYIDVVINKNMKLGQKVLIPVKQFPKFNFVGKLLGPRGNSLKRLQEETLTKMSILGKGSMRDKAKTRRWGGSPPRSLMAAHPSLCRFCLQEEELRKSGEAKYFHLNDDLHVLIEVFAPPAEAYARMGHALEEIKKFLIPDYNDEIRQAQLQELTYLNGGSENADVPVVRGKPALRTRGAPTPAVTRGRGGVAARPVGVGVPRGTATTRTVLSTRGPVSRGRGLLTPRARGAPPTGYRPPPPPPTQDAYGDYVSGRAEQPLGGGRPAGAECERGASGMHDGRA
ncbi:KH domain-containing, RNA-binding, signal transduction-associated protein 3, partial [Galemys pyrenaicus]